VGNHPTFNCRLGGQAPHRNMKCCARTTHASTPRSPWRAGNTPCHNYGASGCGIAASSDLQSCFFGDAKPILQTRALWASKPTLRHSLWGVKLPLVWCSPFYVGRVLHEPLQICDPCFLTTLRHGLPPVDLSATEFRSQSGRKEILHRHGC
jgi:hypothetical protein